MLNAKTYHLDTHSFDWDIVHLFEHLLIQGFFDILPQYGYRPELIGWVNGDTFEDMLFIDCGFYEPEVAQLFDDYMHDLPEFTEEQVQAILSTVECESQSIATITDMKACLSQLLILSKSTWSGESKTREVHPQVLKYKKSKRSFEEMRVIVSSKTLSEEEQKLFQRTYVIVYDIISRDLQKHQGVYFNDSSEVRSDDKGTFGFGFELTAKKPIKAEYVVSAVAEAIKKFPLAGHFSQVKAHFDTFADEPWLQNAPVDYYRYTGIVTTNREIADLATLENFESLLSKLEVSLYEPDDKES